MKTRVLENRCESLFESLSAWIDGEATAEETREVLEHLQVCPACQEVEAALRGLTSATLTVPIPEVPPGFAARTRKLVEERAERAWDVRARRLAGRLAAWLDRLVPGPESLAGALRRDPVLALQGATAGALQAVDGILPSVADRTSAVAALLQTRSERAGLRPPSVWFLLALALYALPAAFLTGIGDVEFAASYLVWVGLGLLVTLPWYHFRMDLAVLVSLRRGRCLEEILATGLEPTRMADSLALFSLRSLYRVSLPVALVLMAGAPLAGGLPTYYWEPLRHAGPAALGVLGWLVLMGLLFSVGSYASQALVLFARNGERLSPACLAVGLTLFGPAAGLVALAAGHGEGATALGLGASLLWVGLAGRTLALWGFEHPARLERWTQSAAPRRNRWIRAWSDNPVVIREAARLAAVIPAGVLGLFLARLVPAAIQAQAAWLLTGMRYESMSLAFWIGITVLGWLVWLRASARTSAALAQEREGGTLEALIQSGLTRQDFVRGWLVVACAPLYLELAVTGALVLMIVGVVPEIVSGATPSGWGTLDLGAALLVLGALAAMPLGGAWSGLAVSAASATRREAGGRAVGSVLRSLGLWVAIWGVAVTALTSAVLLFGLEFRPEVWNALAGSVLPTATLGLTVLGLTWGSRRRVERDLDRLWAGAAPEVGLTPVARSSRRRALILAPALLAGLLLLAQAALQMTLQVVGLASSRFAGGIWIVSCLVAAVAVATLVGWLMRPLLVALADHSNRWAWTGAPVAGFFGGLAGLLAGSTPLTVRVFDQMGLLAGRDPLTMPTWTMVWAALMGSLLGAAVALVGRRILSAGAESDDLSFAERIRAAGGSPALSSAWVLLLGLAVAGHLVEQDRTFPEELPELARQVYSKAEMREQALASVPRDQDGFTLLEPVFMGRKYDRAQVRPSRRHQALLEGFGALAWADQGDRPSSWQALRNEPSRARDSARRLDATLPVLRQALDRPFFVVPPRWSEGPGATVPNYILMRRLAYALRSRADLYEQEGDRSQALDTHLLNLRWCDRIAGQGPLISGMISVALDNVAQEGLLDFLRRNALAGPDLQRVLQAQENRRLGFRSFLDNVDNEFAFGLQTLDLARAGRLDDLNPELKILWILPGTSWARERRIYSTVYLRQREALRAGRTREADASVPSQLSLAEALMPNLSRAGSQITVSVARQHAIRAICLLRLHQLRTGGLPASLDEVWTPLPTGRPEQDPLSHGSFVYRRTADGFVLKSDLRHHRSAVLDRDAEGMYEWYPGLTP